MNPTNTDKISAPAWTLLVGLGLALCICFGVTINAFGVYTLQIAQSFGCSNEEANRPAAVFLLAMSLAMPVGGWLLDRVAPRPVMTLGVALAGISYLLAAQSRELSTFVLAVGVCGLGIGVSTYVPAIMLVTHWVPHRRQGLAFGVLLGTVSVGGILGPTLLTQASAAWGWQGALRLSGWLMLGVCLPLLLSLARLPAGAARLHAHHGHSGESIAGALRAPAYWLWVLMLALLGVSTISLLMTLVPYLVSSGYSPEQAARAFALTSIATLVGNVAFGLLSARWGNARTLLGGTVAGALGVLCLLLVRDSQFGLTALLLFCVVWGTTFNLINQLSPGLLLESMGQRNFGSLLGLGNLISGIGSALGPVGFGHLVDRSHGYTLPLLVNAALMLLALLPIVLMPRPQPAMTSELPIT